jgi:serine phosphatase RsbU (regulator of sigma subunit)
MNAPIRAADRRTIDSLTAELLTVYEELNLLYVLGAELARLTTEEDIAAAALREAIEVVHADSGWFVICDNGELRVPGICLQGITGETAAALSRRVLGWKCDPAAQPLWNDIALENDTTRYDSPSQLLAARLGEAHVQAWLCLGRTQAWPKFNSADQKLITAVAALAGIASENVKLQRSRLEKERLVTELQMARSIQQSLLPRDFSVFPWLTATGESIPCYEIGGDYFDLIPLQDGRCLFVIADVSGKGPPAALRAATVQGNIHAVCRGRIHLPEILATINEAFLRRSSETATFVTVFIAILDYEGRLQYANGGHNRPIWIPAHGPVTELGRGGPLIGIFPDPDFPVGSARLAPGDLIIFYTDGVTDCENESGETFDVERLLTWAETQAGRTPEAVRDNLTREIAEFCGPCRHPDDLTVLIVGYRGL